MTSETTKVFSHPNPRIQCDQLRCGCRANTCIWINTTHKFIFLETPKNAGSSIKQLLNFHNPPEENISPQELMEGFEDYFIFAIYRDFETRMISTYLDFTRSNKPNRLVSMEELGGYSSFDTSRLSFSDFLKFALKHQNHHWNSQVVFQQFHCGPQSREIKINLYNIENLNLLAEALQERAGPAVVLPPLPRKNAAPKRNITVTDKDRLLIKEIYKLDYENLSFFKKHLVQNKRNRAH